MIIIFQANNADTLRITTYYWYFVYTHADNITISSDYKNLIIFYHLFYADD